MPDWLSKIHPVALLGGLLFIGFAAADHYLQAALVTHNFTSWAEQDWTLLTIGGGAFGLGALASGAATVLQNVTVTPTQTPPAPTPAPELTPTPVPPPAPAADLAPGTSVHV